MIAPNPELQALPSASGDRSAEGTHRPLTVLCVDYSIGFGGATKSLGLMLRNLPTIRPIVVTSQRPDVAALWYGRWRVHGFRRWWNYRTQGRLSAWIGRCVPTTLLQWLLLKVAALLDVAVTALQTVRLTWLIRRYRVDVVHLANGFLPAEALLASRLCRVPTLVHLRGFYLSQGPVGRRIARFASLVIGDSEAVTRSFRESNDGARPSRTIYEAVDVASFDAAGQMRDEVRQAWKIGPDEVAVGIFGRVVEWKGQREFVLSMLEAMDEEPRLRAFIVGDASDGTSWYMDEVRRLVDGSKHADRFTWPGYIEAVEPLYAAMDIVVHASVEPEPCGMVILEAMAARHPVIATAAGGPMELVRDGADGSLVPPRDVQAMKKAVLRLGRDAGLRASLGASGYAEALQRFDAPIVAGQLLAAYHSVIGQGFIAQGVTPSSAIETWG